MKLQEWNKLIADKKSVITIILNQCNNATMPQEERLLSVHHMKTIERQDNSLNSLREYVQSITILTTQMYFFVLR